MQNTMNSFKLARISKRGGPLWGALVFLGSLMCVPAWGELTGRQVMEKVADRPKGKDFSAAIRMTLVNRDGKTRQQEVTIRRKEYGEDTRLLIRFTGPASLEGTGFLVWNHKGGDDDQWLYLPATRRVRRIASGIKHGSFMGTDFTHDDLREREVDEDEHRLLRSESWAGVDCYVVESVPKNAEETLYSKVLHWVRRDNFLPSRAEFYDRKGKHLKTLVASDIVEVDGIWIAREVTVENVQAGHKTLWTLSNIRFNTGLDDRIFTQRSLEAP